MSYGSRWPEILTSVWFVDGERAWPCSSWMRGMQLSVKQNKSLPQPTGLPAVMIVFPKGGATRQLQSCTDGPGWLLFAAEVVMALSEAMWALDAYIEVEV